jgi:hypothetical protein
MEYNRFSQLWDALVTNRPLPADAVPADAVPIANGMTPQVASALIEYGQGDKSKISKAREFLAKLAKA